MVSGAGANVSYGLIYRGNLIPLGQVPTVIGRSTSCKIMLDDVEVSRKHARILLQDGELWLEDLQSANGVFVNEDRVEGRRQLRADDRIRIGGQEFSVSRLTEQPRRAKRRRFQTPYGQDQVRSASLDKLWDDEDSSLQVASSTKRTTQLELMARAAEQLFAQNRPEEAADLLEPPLLRVLADAKKGRKPEPDAFAWAVRFAMRLGGATERGRWIEYVFALGAALAEPLTAEQVAGLSEALDRVDGVSDEPVRSYRAALEQRDDVAPELLERLEALARKAAARR